MDKVAEAYDRMADREWQRLVKDSYHSLEFEITMHYLKKHLPKQGHVLDAGGGPGRYSIELCRAEYDVTLIDLSNGNIEKAREKFLSEPPSVQKRLQDAKVGDVRDLSCFESSRFDVVLCLGGVISHISRAKDRSKAVSELVRVAKTGAMVGISAIGYLALLRDCMKDWSDELLSPSFQELIKTGDMTGTTGTLWHFFRADELKKLAESFLMETVAIVGCEGLSAGLEEATNELATDVKKWKTWAHLLMETSNIPAVADMAEHILYLGRVAKT